MKKPLRYFYISLFLFIVACAPRMITAPPPLYKGIDLSLNEIIRNGRIESGILKAVTEIKIERDDKPYNVVSAAVLIKEPDWIHMRIYQLGMLMRDFVIKDDALYILSGKEDMNLKNIGDELHNAIFWWQGLDNGDLARRQDSYIIRTRYKEMHLHRDTLLPARQEITTGNGEILVIYDEPRDYDGLWHASMIKIYINNFTVTVKIKKLLQNPTLGEYDFRIPVTH